MHLVSSSSKSHVHSWPRLNRLPKLLQQPCIPFLRQSRESSIKASKPNSSPSSDFDAWISKNSLPVCLTSAVLLGHFAPSLGVSAAKTPLSNVVLIVIFLISGLQLKPRDALQAMRAWKPIALSLVSLLLISPLTFTPLLYSLGHLLSFPPPLLLGLCVFMASPTALSSGIQLTSLLGGSIALAILLVILSNSLACFSLPFILPIALRGFTSGESSGIDPIALLSKLTSSCLIPTVIGCLLRLSSGMVANIIDGNKGAISLISALCLASLPWIQISTLTSNGSLSTISLTTLASLLLASLLIRFLLLLFNALASFLLIRERDEGSSFKLDLKTMQVVILVTSQRTLPVALALISSLSVETSVRGFASLACVLCHMSWIVVDSAIASYILGKYGKFS